MNNEYLMELMFQLKILKSTGNEFESLFYQVMKKYDRNFIEIKPQGNLGDKKCDGYIKSKGVFFQVYGPEDASNADTQRYAISKLKKDFEGLYAHTQNGTYELIQEFYFVINTKGTQGIYPDLSDKLTDLSNSYPDIYFDYIDTNEIISRFMELRPVHKRQILQSFIPDISFSDIKFSIIQNIVEHLNKTVCRNNFDDNCIVPDFYEKIEFNNLGRKITRALEDANAYIDKLDEFLSDSYSNNAKVELCNIYRTLYSKAKEIYPSDSNSQFKYILNSSYEKNDSLDFPTESAYISNILIIMAKYFNSCDIFEEPKKIE
ncbi:MAG: ABC-three component system protein [Paraclostridium sp.]|uniref:ABC-three component system protein n=1 Tax=Paraclostridium sp. TaxID=2023273 RepID=UPI003EE4C292